MEHLLNSILGSKRLESNFVYRQHWFIIWNWLQTLCTLRQHLCEWYKTIKFLQANQMSRYSYIDFKNSTLVSIRRPQRPVVLSTLLCYFWPRYKSILVHLWSWVLAHLNVTGKRSILDSCTPGLSDKWIWLQSLIYRKAHAARVRTMIWYLRHIMYFQLS